MAKISRNFVANVERGDNVSVDVIDRIAEALQLRELPLRRTALVRTGTNNASGDAAIHINAAIRELELARAAATERQPSAPPPATEGPRGGVLEYFVPAGRAVSDLPFDTAGERADVRQFSVSGYVAAGRPIDEETHDETVMLPGVFVGENEYVLRARGESMIEWGINDGDYLAVERRSIAATGELVIAWYNEGITVKQWFYKRGRRMLVAGNPESETYEIREGDVVEIKGVVTGVWRSTRSVIGSKRVPIERAPRFHSSKGERK